MSSVLITGANRGLGLEFAAEYAAEGWQVFAACRSPAEAEQLKNLAQKAGGKVSILAMDVTDGEASAMPQCTDGRRDRRAHQQRRHRRATRSDHRQS